MTMTKRIDASFYSNIYSNIDRGDIKSVSELEAGTSPALALNYSRLLPEDKSAVILDIGCGWGYFLNYLKKKGYYNIEGIDLLHHAKRLDFIRKNITSNITGADNIEDHLAKNSNKYDLIVLQQVIYYFRKEDLPKIMEAIFASLKPGGRLVVETFNGSLLTSTFVQNWDYERKMIFTEYSLAEILVDSGFTLKELSGLKLPRDMRPKAVIRRFAQSAWLCVLRLIYMLERGTDAALVPHIFDKHIIAVAQKEAR